MGVSINTLGFQTILGLLADGQHTASFLHLVGLSVPAEQLRDIVVCMF